MTPKKKVTHYPPRRRCHRESGLVLCDAERSCSRHPLAPLGSDVIYAVNDVTVFNVIL